MRILVIGKFYVEGFALHIAETLSAMGHLVRRFEPGLRMGRTSGRLGQRLDQVRGHVFAATDNLPSVRSWRMQRLWRVTDEDPLDVVVVCSDFLWPDEVHELKRRTNAVVAMWYPDALVNFGKSYFMNAPYDGLFFKDPYIVHRLDQVVSSQVYYLPECFNPECHRLPESETVGEVYQCDITTAGNAHSWRVAHLKHLAEYNIKIWGGAAPLWMPMDCLARMHQGRSVLNEDKARAFLGARIVLNNLHFGEIWGLNVRAFEAAGIGAFQLIDWRPGLSQLFADGRELVSFKGIADLKRLIACYLPKESERRAIAAAGQRRAIAEHTYQHRLDLLLKTLGGEASGFPMPGINEVGA